MGLVGLHAEILVDDEQREGSLARVDRLAGRVISHSQRDEMASPPESASIEIENGASPGSWIFIAPRYAGQKIEDALDESQRMYVWHYPPGARRQDAHTGFAIVVLKLSVPAR